MKNLGRGGHRHRAVGVFLPSARPIVAVMLAAVQCAGTAGRARASSFADVLRSPVEQGIATSLAKSIGRSLPLVTASPGFVYRFDPETGSFQRETVVVGQLYLERAEPIGKGTLDLSLSYQRVKFDTFYGKNIGGLSDRQPIAPDGFIVPRFDLRLDTEQMTAGITYGVTPEAEINLTIPVLYSDFGLAAVVQSPAQGGQSFSEGVNFGSSKYGVGDLFLRGKYQLLSRDWVAASLGLVLRIPTGNQDNFQGTGTVELAPMLYVSGRNVRLGPCRLKPYLNGGIDFDTQNVDSSEGRWGTGLDFGITDWATLAVAFLARNQFARTVPAGSFDLPRGTVSNGNFTSNGAFAPAFGITPTRTDYYDLSIGGRVELWRETLVAFANVILPLNRGGFRADAIPLAGVEYTF